MLDPIDGTVNFVYGIPAYAVSVAAQVDGVSVAGAVADVAAGEVYSAARGLGAHVTDATGRQPLRCNARRRAVDGVGGHRVRLLAASGARRRPQCWPSCCREVRDVRRIGSAALDLCMVAAGRLDAYYEHGLQVWDWAAGALIAAEAGARVRLPAGRRTDGARELVVGRGAGHRRPS